MREGQGQERRRWGGTVCLLLALAFVLIWAGCGTLNNNPAPPAAAVVSTTAEVSTTTPASRAELDTRVALRQVAFATSVALTPPMDKRPPEALTALPTETPELGMLSDCGTRTNSRAPRILSCWRGVIDGNIVDVEAGQ